MIQILVFFSLSQLLFLLQELALMLGFTSACGKRVWIEEHMPVVSSFISTSMHQLLTYRSVITTNQSSKTLTIMYGEFRLLVSRNALRELWYIPENGLLDLLDILIAVTIVQDVRQSVYVFGILLFSIGKYLDALSIRLSRCELCKLDLS